MAIDTGFMGPNYSISTACATANYAFVAAANHIRKGEADVMLAGGSEAPIIPVGLGGFVACRWRSPRPVTRAGQWTPWPCACLAVIALMPHRAQRGTQSRGVHPPAPWPNVCLA